MSYGSSLRNISNGLNSYKVSLNNKWQAEEMLYINNVIDSINRDIISLASNIDSLVADIACTSQEIRCEDATKAKALVDNATRAALEK